MPRGERPLGPGHEVVVRFARDLRLLREKCGSPTYRELSSLAHYSAAALSEAAGGRKLPSLAVTLAYVAACGGDAAEWETRWRSVAAELASTTVEARDEDVSRPPYVGLAPFQQEDADRFFGREELVAELVDRLRQRRFLGVLGASGSGKSSLLRAGLAVRVGAPVVVFAPGRAPIEECAIRLARLVGESPGTLCAEFSADPRNLHLRLRQSMIGHATDTDVVLVVDQFEELFTLCGDERERASLIDALVIAATDPSSRARVVLGIRADFLGRCGQYPGLVHALRDAQVLVGPMTADELRLAITAPAEQAGYRVETALVARVVADATRQPGMLPLVSHALLQTWLRRHGKVMTRTGYDAAGGIEHALARSAEQVYQELTTGQRHVARQIFLRLTALGEGTEDTKRRIAGDELDQDDPDLAQVLDTLTRARLITLGHDSVEIAHEALIRHWPRLRDWLAEDREGHRLRSRLTDTVLEWERHDRDDDLLYRGARLAAWADRPLDQLNDAERAFLTASRRAAAREQRVRRRRVRWTIGGLGSATVAVTVLAVIALVMGARAEDERALAVGRQLVADARAQSQADPELGLLLGEEAFTRGPNDDTEAALRQAATDSHIRATLPAHQVDSTATEDLAVSGVTFSPDGTHLVATDTGGTFQVWDWESGELARRAPRVLRSGSSLRSPVFSPDGNHLAAATISGGVTLARNWAAGGEPEALAVDQGETTSVAFSPDGLHVVSGGLDGTIRITAVAGGGAPLVLSGHTGGVLDVDYSPDGRLLVSSGEDGTVRVWEVAGGRPVRSWRHGVRVASVAFGANGFVVSADSDGAIRTWDPANPAGPVVIGMHTRGVLDVAVSADGHWIAGAGVDATVRIWNAGHHAEPVVLRGHRGGVGAVAFSPDGRTVLSAGDDGTAKVWDVDEVEYQTVFRGHRGPVSSAVPSPDGRRVASGGGDGSVLLWDIAGDRAPVVLRGNDQPVYQVAFSPDGRYVAAVTGDETVFVWHTRDPAEPLRLRSPGWPILHVAFSPDSERLAAANLDESVWIWQLPEAGHPGEPEVSKLRSGHVPLSEVTWSADGRHLAAAGDSILVWDLRSRAEPVVLSGYRGDTQALTFSPAGTHLAAADTDGVVHLWDLADLGHPAVFRGGQDAIWNVAFSQDGSRLLTSGSDATVGIWRTDGAGEPLVIDGFRASVEGVATFADGRYLTTHDDGTVRVWRCRTCGPVSQVLAHAGRHLTRDLTPQERRTYLP